MQGDLVLLKDDGVQCGRWPKGIVVKACASADGLVREVMVKTEKGVTRRDVRKLCLLEGDQRQDGNVDLGIKSRRRLLGAGVRFIET